MLRLVIATALSCVGVVSSVYAQSAPVAPYAAPDAELWGLMVKAVSDVSMPLPAHQAVQGIMANVLREAQNRAAAARLAPPKEPEK